MWLDGKGELRMQKWFRIQWLVSEWVRACVIGWERLINYSRGKRLSLKMWQARWAFSWKLVVRRRENKATTVTRLSHGMYWNDTHVLPEVRSVSQQEVSAAHAHMMQKSRRKNSSKCGRWMNVVLTVSSCCFCTWHRCSEKAVVPSRGIDLIGDDQGHTEARRLHSRKIKL